MRGEVSLPFGVLGIPWGYIPGVLLLGERGLRGLSNLSDEHPVSSQREIDEADRVLKSAPCISSADRVLLGTSASLGEIRSAMTRMMSVSLSRVKCSRPPTAM
jgi:hypothetical protein